MNKKDSFALYKVMKNFFLAGNICQHLAILQILLNGTSRCTSVVVLCALHTGRSGRRLLFLSRSGSRLLFSRGVYCEWVGVIVLYRIVFDRKRKSIACCLVCGHLCVLIQWFNRLVCSCLIVKNMFVKVKTKEYCK